MFGIFDRDHSQKIKGTVVLMPKNVLDFNAVTSVKQGGLLDAAGNILDAAGSLVGGIIDGATAFLGRNVSLRLISATKTDGLSSLPSYLRLFNSFFPYIFQKRQIFYAFGIFTKLLVCKPTHHIFILNIKCDQ